MYVKPETKSAEEIKKHIENLKKRYQEIRKMKQKNKATQKRKEEFQKLLNTMFESDKYKPFKNDFLKQLHSIKGCNVIDTMKMRISKMPRLFRQHKNLYDKKHQKKKNVNLCRYLTNEIIDSVINKKIIEQNEKKRSNRKKNIRLI